MNVTIYDVAREANVSMATVSRVINGNQNVKPTTRKKVLEIVEKLNYRPNAVARGLASKKTTTVGVVIPDISNIYYSELTRGIEDIAKMYNYSIILTNSDKNFEKEMDLIKDLGAKQVDGLLFMGANITQAHYDNFKSLNASVVLAGSIDPNRVLASVNIDYTKATYDAVQYFINKGHKKIGLVIGPLKETMNSKFIISGIQKALDEAGLELLSSHLFEGKHTYQSGVEAVESFVLLPEDQRPTAVFSSGDEMALGVIHTAMDHGLKVPEDLEVMSFEDTRLAKMVRPTLSTISQPMYDIGAVSMRLLTKYMNKEEVQENTIFLPHRIEIRNSTK